MAWIEVAEAVFQRRYQPLDVSVVVILGDDRLAVVDTRNNPAEANELISDIAARFKTPVNLVVNTHAHYDHTFGNQVFNQHPSVHGPQILGHVNIPQHFAEFEGPRLARVQADPALEPDKNWAEVRLTPPTSLVDTDTEIDLGHRRIRLLPQPPAHTNTDLVIHVPDTGVWIVGDLVEESGPPMYGSGSYPLQWPAVLQKLRGQMSATDLIIPGHGAVVGPDFVDNQAKDLELVAALICDAHSAGWTADQTLAQNLPWPFPDQIIESAVHQGLSSLAGRTELED